MCHRIWHIIDTKYRSENGFKAPHPVSKSYFLFETLGDYLTHITPLTYRLTFTWISAYSYLLSFMPGMPYLSNYSFLCLLLKTNN